MGRSASYWWPTFDDEPTHEKNYIVAERLRIPLMQAFGHIRAFRTRYSTESPKGRLRGGVVQVERLALWEGERGVLAEAFLEAHIIDIGEGGDFVAHEHDLYAGDTQKHRFDARERTKKWRKRKEKTAALTVEAKETERGL